jgi:hypothetical protein
VPDVPEIAIGECGGVRYTSWIAMRRDFEC